MWTGRRQWVWCPPSTFFLRFSLYKSTQIKNDILSGLQTRSRKLTTLKFTDIILYMHSATVIIAEAWEDVNMKYNVAEDLVLFWATIWFFEPIYIRIHILANCRDYDFSSSCLQCTHGYTDNHHWITLTTKETSKRDLPLQCFLSAFMGVYSILYLWNDILKKCI